MSLKIAFFVNSFPSISETFIVNQIIGLLDLGHEVSIIARLRSTVDTPHDTVKEYNLLDKTIFLSDFPNRRNYRLKKLSEGLATRPIFTLRWISKFLRNKRLAGLSVYEIIPYLKTPAFDVVHAHFGSTGKYVLQLRDAGLFSNVKFITTFHGYDMMVEEGFYKNLFASDVLITANSLYSKTRLLQLGCAENKINILPVSLNTSYFQRAKNNHQIFTILFVGRLIALKGPHLFIDICAELIKRSQFKFRAVIIGDGELKDQLANQIKHQGLESIVELSGAKTQAEIKIQMQNSDVFVLPGITENGRAETQGLVIQEAQSMELPVVVSDAGGMKEGLIDNVTGFVVPEGDIQAFADKICLLAIDKELGKCMGEKGRDFVIENYSLVSVTQSLLNIYNN